MRSAPIRKDTVNEVSANRFADADGGQRSVAPFRLLRYTAAASAAALGSAANAAIVTGGTVTSGVFSTYPNTALDKSDFGNALNIKFSVTAGEASSRRLKVARDGSNGGLFQILRTNNQPNVIHRSAVGLGYGDVIPATPGAGQEWATFAKLARSYTYLNGPAAGDWYGVEGSWKLGGATPNSVQHYLAFRFTTDNGATYQYGWMNVEWWGQQTNDDVRVTINGWAYNTAGSITAGFSGTAVPSGGGVLALAAGAAGLRGRRRVRG